MHSARGVSKCRRRRGRRGGSTFAEQQNFFHDCSDCCCCCLPSSDAASLFLSHPPLALSLCVFGLLFAFSPSQAKPSQAKATAADAFFSARNKIDPGKSRLEINLARPQRRQQAGRGWRRLCVWQVNQPKKSQEPSDSCLASPLLLPCPQPKYVLSLLAGNERWQNAISNAFPLRPLALPTHTHNN